ncbi:unnamed protein product, partial [Mesorhabditis spiculigera]
MDDAVNSTANDTMQCTQELQMDDIYKYGLIFAYGVVGILSLVGNLVVVLIVICRREMRTATNIFISSVSVADLVITLFSLWASPLAYYYRHWYFGEAMCYLVYMVQGASLMWAPLALAAIAVDRYLLVANPFRQQLTPCSCLMVIVAIWAGGFMVLSPIFTHLRYYDWGPCHKYCIEQWDPQFNRLYYGVFVLFIRSFLPLTVISWCHYRIASILSSQNSKLQKHRSTTTIGASLDIRRKQRLQKLLLSMVLIFAVSSLPMDIFNVYQDVELNFKFNLYPQRIIDVLYYFSHWLAMTGTLLNPLIYAWWNDNFRRQIKLIFQEIRGVRQPPFHSSLHEKSRTEKNHDRVTEQQIVLHCADGEDESNDIQI